MTGGTGQGEELPFVWEKGDRRMVAGGGREEGQEFTSVPTNHTLLV